MALQNFSFTKSGNKHIPNKTILAIISPTPNFTQIPIKLKGNYPKLNFRINIQDFSSQYQIKFKDLSFNPSTCFKKLI